MKHKDPGLIRTPRWWWLPGALLIALDLLCLASSLWLDLPHGVELAAHALILLFSVALLALLWRSWRQLQLDQQRLHDGLAVLDEGFALFDPDDKLVLANPAFARLDGERHANWRRGTPFESILRTLLAAEPVAQSLGREEEWLQQRLQRHRQPGQPWVMQLANQRWIRVLERRCADGSLVYLRSDVSELVLSQQALQDSEARLQAIISTAEVAIITADSAGLIGSANPAAERLFGQSASELLGQDLRQLVDELDRPRLVEQLHQLGEAGGAQSLSLELCARHRSGQALTLHLSLAKVLGGSAATLVCVLTDLTERKRFELELRHANEQLLRLSTTDALTELANRRLLMQRLEEEWRRALRSGEPLSLLLVDVDYFKLYNDHYGHQAGDTCLRQVADVLRLSVNRSTDLVARYGGEEFVLLLAATDMKGAQEVAERCQQQLQAVALEHALSPLGPHLTLSIGLACGRPLPGASASQWLANADLALYQAKAQGRNRTVTLPMH